MMVGKVETEGRDGPFRHALEALPRTPLADGRNLIEHTVVDDVTYWWFFDIEYRDIVRRLADHGRKHLETKSRTTRNLARHSRLMPWLYRALAARSRRRARQVLEAAGRAPPTGTPATGRGPRVLFSAQNRMWKPFRAPTTGADRSHDVFWDPVVRTLHTQGVEDLVSTYPVAGTGWPWPDDAGPRILHEKLRTPHGLDHFPTDLFWDPGVARAERIHRRRLGKTWRRLADDPVLQDALAEDPTTGPALREELHYAFTVLMPRMAGLVSLMERTVATLGPDGVVMLNEYGRLERALVEAARRHDIPVVAVQHGVIHPDHPGYMFAPGEVAPDGRATPPHVPIPDETLVYGDYPRALLIDAGYPPEAVTVTGHPRTDLLHAAPDIYDPAEILRGHGLDPHIPTVVWTTQTHSLPTEENAAYRDAVRGMVDVLKDRIQVLLKLHPGEDPTASFYREALDIPPDPPQDPSLSPHCIGRSRSLPVAVAGAHADIFGILHAARVVLTKNSTTAMEAVALGRAVVVLNLSGRRDLVDYVAQGVARGVYAPQDLAPAVADLIDDDSEQATHRSAYVARYMHKVDGHAVDRIAERIQARLADKDRQ